ncbi:MAG: ribosome recycling factor [Gammaproteobacteria bacterium]|nr:ribosome recycling factor [Gammaproteobacteria bacterium]
MDLNQAKTAADEKMKQALAMLNEHLSRIRSARAHPSLLESVQVDYYGTPSALHQVATITQLDARTLNVIPWEKNLLSKIEKAIRESDLGLNPMSQADGIRIQIPQMTEERRKAMAKLVRSEGENAKVSVRNIRRDINDATKKHLKDKKITEDEQKRAEDLVQKATDKYILEIDKMIANKEKDILSV